ncbi:MAG: sodium/proton-translocating pyrophosphatase, partial [Nitrosopumilus sp.]
MEISEILPFIAGIASFLVAGGLVAWISKQSPGTQEMVDISNAVKVGAAAFLKREMTIIVPVAIALTLIIGVYLTPSNGLAFAVGAALSAVAGIISLKITVKA